MTDEGTQGYTDDSYIEPWTDGEKTHGTPDIVMVSSSVLSHLLDYHNTCTSCLLNEFLGRRAE